MQQVVGVFGGHTFTRAPRPPCAVPVRFYVALSCESWAAPRRDPVSRALFNILQSNRPGPTRVGCFPPIPSQVKKKKAFEDLAQHLRTDDNKIATYQGKPITTSAGACTADNVAGGSLS